jgi:hypothetical protein
VHTRQMQTSASRAALPRWCDERPSRISGRLKEQGGDSACKGPGVVHFFLLLCVRGRSTKVAFFDLRRAGHLDAPLRVLTAQRRRDRKKELVIAAAGADAIWIGAGQLLSLRGRRGGQDDSTEELVGGRMRLGRRGLRKRVSERRLQNGPP